MTKPNSKPFWRESKGAYYCWIDGHQKSLGKKKQEAWTRYRELMADRDKLTARKAWTVRDCFDHYLEYAATLEPNSYRNRQQTLVAFCDEARVGALPCTDLTVDHLEAWVRTKDWSASTRRTKINYVMTAFNYCLKRKKIGENPIHGIEKPRWERRKEVIDEEDERKVYAAARGAFRDILTVLRQTGARPSELCGAEIRHYADGVITLDRHKTDESGDERTIYLSGEARDVVERLIGERPAGPIFRNAEGNPWTPDTLYCRFKRLRKKLGLGDGVFPYAVRHRFTSDAINNQNANPAMVARQLGHAGLEQLMKHYFREDPEAMKRAIAEMARKNG